MIIVPEIYHESTYININVVIIFLVAGTYLEKELPEVRKARSLHPSGYNVFFNEFTDGDDKVSTMLLIVKNTLNSLRCQKIVFNKVQDVSTTITSPVLNQKR